MNTVTRSAAAVCAGAGEPLDVLVVGGGPVGASAAALLKVSAKRAHHPLRVALLEARRPAPTAPDAAIDARVSALSRASERILTAIGAWPLIPYSRMQPYERMRVWHERVQPRSADVLEFDAAYAGEPNLGYIIENRLVQTAALTAFESAGGKVIAGELSRLRVHDRHVELETSAGTLACRLVVGADGARSSVRESLGLAAETSSYRQTAIVANVRSELPHERTAWQRFLRAGTLAFLPLADGCSSIVWSADDAAALCELILGAWRMREDPGAQSVLRRYERWRKSEIEPMALAIDGFNRYLAHGVGPLSRIAQRGLALVNRSDEAKRFFIARALGLGGELPQIARRPSSAPPPVSPPLP